MYRNPGRWPGLLHFAPLALSTFRPVGAESARKDFLCQARGHQQYFFDLQRNKIAFAVSLSSVMVPRLKS